jgi:RecA-family ATPase
LAGALLRSGQSEDTVQEFVGAIAEAAGDEEAVERPRDVTTTAGRLESGEPATGTPTLAQLMPREVVEKAFSWLGIEWNTTTHKRGSRPLVKTASDIEPEEVRYLSRGRLAYGKVTVEDGDPDCGKSLITLDIASRISTGRPLFDLHEPVERSDVLFVCCEDGLGDTIRPRLEAHGADPRRVHFLQEVEQADGERRLPKIPEDLETIRTVVEQHGAQLLVIDPISAYLGDGIDSHKDSKMRQALAPLAKLAEDTGVAVIVVRHLRKAETSKAIYAGLGSIALTALARFALVVARDPDNPEDRVLASAKCNVTQKPPSLRFRIKTATGTSKSITWECGQIEWLGESEITADELVQQTQGPARAKQLEEAKDRLRQELVSGPVASADLFEAAKAQGFSKSTVRRAKRELGVVDRKKATPEGTRTFWMLDKDQDQFLRGGDGVPNKDEGPVLRLLPSTVSPPNEENDE